MIIIIYPTTSQTNKTVNASYDIKASYDWVDISPEHCAPREGHILI
ncbi:MAG: hypothetical protein MJ209_02230 [archaeon]|nr:hypothetical protein [archaeon]